MELLYLEVVVEVAARDPHHLGDVRERRRLIALSIEQPVGCFDDVLASSLLGHEALVGQSS